MTITKDKNKKLIHFIKSGYLPVGPVRTIDRFIYRMPNKYISRNKKSRR